MSAKKMQVTIRQITEFTSEEVETASTVLAEAFSKDPFTWVATDNERDHFVPLFKAFVLAASVKGEGEVYLAETKEGVAAGCAVWFVPGKDVFGSDEQKAKGPGLLQKTYNADLWDWWANSFLPVFGGRAKACFGDDTKVESWHLQVLGTHPNFQRMGVGRALIDHVAKKPEAKGKDMVIEVVKKSNLNYYISQGFKVVGKGIYIKRRNFKGMGEPLGPDPEGDISETGEELVDAGESEEVLRRSGGFPLWILKRDPIH